jgi:hypothetical protein
MFVFAFELGIPRQNTIYREQVMPKVISSEPWALSEYHIIKYVKET